MRSLFTRSSGRNIWKAKNQTKLKSKSPDFSGLIIFAGFFGYSLGYWIKKAKLVDTGFLFGFSGGYGFKQQLLSYKIKFKN